MPSRRRVASRVVLRRGALALLALVALLCSGCAAGRGDAGGDVTGPVVVLAASSMREAMSAIAEAFEDAHPGTNVAPTFDGSSGLAAAILEGAPGDVFVSADDATMSRVQRSGAATTMALVIASNTLVIAVEAGNPLGVRGLGDLARVELSLCRTDVPCGSYAEQLFALAGVPVPEAGRESNVKAVLTKVQLGEADAGIVYRTDLLGASHVSGVEVPEAQRVKVEYSAIALADAPNPRAAKAFMAFLASREARAALRAAGFGR